MLRQWNCHGTTAWSACERVYHQLLSQPTRHQFADFPGPTCICSVIFKFIDPLPVTSRGSVPRHSSTLGSWALLPLSQSWLHQTGPCCSYSHPQDLLWLFLQLLPLFPPSPKNIPAAITALCWSLQPAKPSLTSLFPYLPPSPGDIYGPYVEYCPIKKLQHNSTEATNHGHQFLGWQTSFKIHSYLLQWQILSLWTTYECYLFLDKILGSNTGLYKYRPPLLMYFLQQERPFRW